MSLVLLISLVLCLSVNRAAAGGLTPINRASVITARGVRISLWLTEPRDVYPRGALVPVTVRLRNVSRFPEVWAFACGTENPRVEVMTPQETVRYPPTLPPLVAPQCPAAGTQPFLPAGKMFQRQFLVVMRARLLRATWDFLTASPRLGRDQPARASTGPVAVDLVTGQRPVATVHGIPGVYATVQPPPGTRGPLRFIDEARCPSGGGDGPRVVQNMFEWRPVAGQEIRPPCANPIGWRAVAGWVDEPVVTITYTRP